MVEKKSFLNKEAAIKFYKELVSDTYRIKEAKVVKENTWHWPYGQIDKMTYGTVYSVLYVETTKVDKIKIRLGMTA